MARKTKLQNLASEFTRMTVFFVTKANDVKNKDAALYNDILKMPWFMPSVSDKDLAPRIDIALQILERMIDYGEKHNLPKGARPTKGKKSAKRITLKEMSELKDKLITQKPKTKALTPAA